MLNLSRVLKYWFLSTVFMITGLASDPPRFLDPRSFNSSGNGWTVIPTSGALDFNVRLATIPGEIPISLVMHYWASTCLHQEIGLHPSPTDIIWEEPIRCRISIDGPYPSIDGMVIGDTIPFNPGVPLKALSRYGLSDKSWDQVETHVSGNFIHYWASIQDCGKWASRVSELMPEGFRMSGDKLQVLAGANIVQINKMVIGAAKTSFVPILWVDRFGHWVSFRWKFKTISPDHNVWTVEATNQRGLGLRAQWNEGDISNKPTTIEEVVFRADFIGFQAQSIQACGYQGEVSNAKEMGAIGSPELTGGTNSRGTPSFRPSVLVMDKPDNLPLPEYFREGHSVIHSAKTETPWGSPLRWSFQYNSNFSELESFTDTRCVTTNFHYQTNYYYPGPDWGATGLWRWSKRAVVSAESLDPQTGVALKRKWDYQLPGYELFHYPVHWTSNTWKTTRTEQFDLGSETQVRSLEWEFAGPDKGIHFFNGALVGQKITTSDKTWASVRNELTTGGIDGKKSLVYSSLYEADGQPVSAMLVQWDRTGALPLGQTLGSGGRIRKQSTCRYDTNFGQLNAGRLKSKTLQDGPSTSSHAGMKSGNTYEQVWLYDEDGLLLQHEVVAKEGKKGTAYRYDSEGHQIYATVFGNEGPDGAHCRETTYCVGANGLPASSVTKFRSPNGGQDLLSMSWDYDALGHVIRETDARGVTTFRAYDARGRLLSETTQGEPTLTYEYPSEHQTECFSSDGRHSAEAFDGFGRTTSRIRPDGITERIKYDLLGRPSSRTEISTSGKAREINQSLDPLGRALRTTTYATPLVAVTEYATNGTLSRSTTSLSDGTRFTIWKDVLGRDVQISNELATTNIDYDLMDRPIQVTQTAGDIQQSRRFQYDGLGNLVSKTEPETGTTDYGDFDALGNAHLIQNQGQNRWLDYDGLGRLRLVQAQGDFTSYLYDGPFLKSASFTPASDRGITTLQTFAYATPSTGARLDSETLEILGKSDPFTTNYHYDGFGRLSSLTYPSGRVVDYAFDTLGRTNRVSADGHEAFSIGYNEWGRLERIDFASGAKDHWYWDDPGIHPHHCTFAPTGEPPLEMFYEWDARGHLTRGGGWDNLVHDQNGRLISASCPSVGMKFKHDSFNNNTASQSSCLSPGWNNFSFNQMPDNRIPALDAQGAPTGWSYNPRGEAIQMGESSGAATRLNLYWNGLGRLASTRTLSQGAADSLEQHYHYDAFGNRILVLDGASPESTRFYIHNRQGLLLSQLRWQKKPLWLRDVLYLGTLPLAEIDSAGIHELHLDHLGTPRLVTSGTTGAVEGTQSFGPFGEPMPSPQTSGYGPLLGFCGHQTTDANGLICMRYRYYSPAWHRFLSSDGGEDKTSWNQFAYVGGSPLMFFDATGLFSWNAWDRFWSKVGESINWNQNRKLFAIAAAVALCVVVDVASYGTAVGTNGAFLTWVAGIVETVGGPVVANAIIGAIAGGAIGGDWRSAAQGALIGAAIGMVGEWYTGAALAEHVAHPSFKGILAQARAGMGEMLNPVEKFGNYGLRLLGRMAGSGLFQAATNGGSPWNNFRDGFIHAAVLSAFGFDFPKANGSLAYFGNQMVAEWIYRSFRNLPTHIENAGSPAFSAAGCHWLDPSWPWLE